MRILFCNTGWMKYYNGITEDDNLRHGGSYVEETQHGVEQYNFMYHNGNYYGYVNIGSNKGVSNQMHIERIHGGYTNYNEAQDVLVIWTAKDDDNGVKIIGWYKNATVFRDYQFFSTIDLLRWEIFYNISAKAENCILLPIEERTFNIPRASTSKDGIGMGQANIWYADKKEAQGFVHSVVKYVKSYNGEKLNWIPSKDELEEETNDSYSSIDEYINKANELENSGQNIKAIQYCNKALINNPDDIEANNCKGNILLNLNMFDGAIKYYNKALEQDNNAIGVCYNLGLAHGFKGDNEIALEYFDKLLSVDEDDAYTRAFKGVALFNLNKVEEAKKEFVKAGEIAPDVEWIQYLNELDIQN